jgi:hypothetical protein
MQRLTRSQRNVPVLALWNFIAFCAQYSEAFHQFDARFGWVDHIVNKATLSGKVRVGIFFGVFSH